jgi:exopolyphosphatase / guanosine-5'-triphosphate,3'-diphosphate pyrophosphatase
MSTERRLAVVDLGSNSFRLVVFSWEPGRWWKRTDEIHQVVRIGEGLDAAGTLQPEPLSRALETVQLYAHFCAATGIEDIRAVATSAIRDASNRDEFLRRAALDVEVLSEEQEAYYGYLATVNSTTLTDGVALDIGGGSMQLTRVEGRHAADKRSWPLGAVRMTERFLARERVKPKHLKALREHVAEEIGEAPWVGAGRIAGIGGTVRNLAAAAELDHDLPSFGVQGFSLRRKTLGDLVDRLAELPPGERAKVPGIKPERADVILAGAVVVQAVMDVGDYGALEVTEAGLREGVFFASLLSDHDPPLFDDVRAASVRNLAAQYNADEAHTEHVAALSLAMWDALGPGDPVERELLWAAAMLHDIGMAIDYDDHHKHSRYLILNAGLPGFSPRETVLIGQIARYHRKGRPGLGPYSALAEDGDEELVTRCATVLRLAEELERSRDQAVDRVQVQLSDGVARLRLHAHEDVSVARWAAQREGDLFRRAFGRDLEVSAAPRRAAGEPVARPKAETEARSTARS